MKNIGKRILKLLAQIWFGFTLLVLASTIFSGGSQDYFAIVLVYFIGVAFFLISYIRTLKK